MALALVEAGQTMSVINQLLRDLDARAASEKERAGLPSRLRPLPPMALARQQHWPMLALGVVLGAAIAGSIATVVMRPAVVPVATEPVAVPKGGMPMSAVTPAVPLEPASLQPAVPVDGGEMKMATQLTPAQAPETQRAPPPPVKATESRQPAPPRPKGLALAPAPVPVGAADAQIDKRPKGGAGSQGRDLAEGEYRKGMQAAKGGDNAAALSLFRHALEFDPAHARARQALLSVLVGERLWADARQVAQAGLALDPAQPGWAMILSRLQLEQGDVAAAATTLERHAAHAQGDADYQGLFAYLLQKQQRSAEAAEHFRTAVTLRPDEGRWWFGLGLALEGAGRSGEAKAAYAKAREAGNLPADMNSMVEQKLR